jgi:DNA-directed RNA polymerase subunit H (RpoH/RPB5)
MSNLTLASRLLKVKRHQIEMIRDRGYDVTEELGLLEVSERDFYQHYGTHAEQNGVSLRSLMSRLYEKPGQEDKVLVFYVEPPSGKQIGIDTIKDLISLLRHYQCNNGIIIGEAPPSTQALEELRKVPLLHVQIFNDNELMYNPTKHYLVPKHRALSEEEAKVFLEENKLYITRMPSLLVNTGKMVDPIAKWYDFRPGQIIEITRENSAFETDVTIEIAYRAVI